MIAKPKWSCLGIALWVLAASCSSEPVSPESSSTPEENASSPSDTEVAAGGVGELEIRANGEDFVRQGFVTKDGWQVGFDHVYVTLSEIVAHQDGAADGKSEDDAKVAVEAPVTVDLAEGGETADTILVATLDAPAGRYSALSWEMPPAPEGPAAGYPLFLQGQATKDGETIDFTLKLDNELAFACGDYVGDDRKGFVEADETGDLEATFHFDHLFGDGEAPADDDINTGALGFDPFAELADGTTLEVDTATLESEFSEAEYQQLLKILPGLGHVGEGHCEETKLTASS